MSEVISFRQNKDNPREAKAVQVLRTWTAQVFNVRHIITEALLTLGGSESGLETPTLDSLKETLSHVSQLLEQIERGEYPQTVKWNAEPAHIGLTECFIAYIKKDGKTRPKAQLKKLY